MSEPPKPPPQTSSAQVGVLAGTMRRLYIAQMQARLKVPNYKLTAKNNDIKMWEKAARVCIAVSATPESFLQSLFEACAPGHPFVSQMGSDWAAYKYREYAQRCTGGKLGDSGSGDDTPAAEELKFNLRMIGNKMMKLAGTADPLDPKVQELLLYNFSGIDPLMRCALCGGDPAVFQAFGEQAKAMLQTNPPMAAAMRALGLPADDILTYQHEQSYRD